MVAAELSREFAGVNPTTEEVIRALTATMAEFAPKEAEVSDTAKPAPDATNQCGENLTEVSYVEVWELMNILELGRSDRLASFEETIRSRPLVRSNILDELTRLDVLRSISPQDCISAGKGGDAIRVELSEKGWLMLQLLRGLREVIQNHLEELMIDAAPPVPVG